MRFLFGRRPPKGHPIDRLNKLPPVPINLARALIDSGRNPNPGYKRTAYNAAVNDFSVWARQAGYSTGDQRYYLRHILRVK